MSTIFKDGGSGGPPQSGPQGNSSSSPSGGPPGDLQERGLKLDLVDAETRRIIGDGSAGETIDHYGTCWDGKVTNPHNPARRDVAQLQANSYIVLQWNQDNPGIWPLHCHIAWHLSAGFVWSVLEHPDQLMNGLKVPDSTLQTCDNWNAWTESHQVSDFLVPSSYAC